MSSPLDQSAYQVRFDWGEHGVQRVAASEIVVIVDVLLFSSSIVDAVSVDGEAPASGASRADDGAGVADAAHRTGALVLAGCLRNASAIARAVLAEQHRRAARTAVTVIAVGEGASGSGLRFAVEDQLGAGAVIAALADAGIDHSSPEAAAAAESFRALRPALSHLLTASGSGRELAHAGRVAEVREAARLDVAGTVPVLQGDRFVALG